MRGQLAGGNQARYVLDPDLQLTDEPIQRRS